MMINRRQLLAGVARSPPPPRYWLDFLQQRCQPVIPFSFYLLQIVILSRSWMQLKEQVPLFEKQANSKLTSRYKAETMSSMQPL